ncbi:hypothetical protein HII12_003359 [Brettanomyces bruxellensis]|nr:hypothetical protein HII12_003359 [Brettanomyces bruxellensis]
MPASGEESARNGETTESKRQMPVPATNKFDGFPKNDAEEEEEEEIENYTNQYGMYYNVFPNKPHSGSKRSPHADSEFGYVMPFNPS